MPGPSRCTRDHEGDPRFELLLGATYLGVSRLPARPDRPAGGGRRRRRRPPPGVARPRRRTRAGIAGRQSGSRPPTGRRPSRRRIGPAGWRAQGLRWLQAAADRRRPTRTSSRIFVATSDLNDLYPQSLDVLRKDAPPLHDRQLDAALAQRLWENHYDQELVERTADLDPRQPATDAATLAYRASALYELAPPPRAAAARRRPRHRPAAAPAAGPRLRRAVAPSPAEASAEAAAIVQALSERKDDPSAEAWAMLLRAEYARPRRRGRDAGGDRARW